MNTNKDLLEKSILKYINWLQDYGDLSYDRMDFWSSKMGIYTKKLYYKNKFLGAPLAVWGLLLENYFPEIQKIYAKPRREAIGDAHYASAFLNLFELTKNSEYLKKAEKYIEALRQSRCKNYSNACWGYTFGWETAIGFLPSEVPFITVTPYPFWAFKKHYQLTGNKESLDMVQSIADFAIEDLNKIEVNGFIGTSYSPIDHNPVINANSYRAAILCEAFDLFKKNEYLKSALENIELVKAFQGSEGQWYYEAKDDKNNFIDNFHTCFVIRNLYRCNVVLNDMNLQKTILKGYDYYKKYLLKKDLMPKHFAVSKYIKLRKYEMYDFAEGITLGCLLKDIDPDAVNIAKMLAEKLITSYQLEKGYFVTRVASMNIKHIVPYHRWPQAQIFYSLTNMLKTIF